MVAYPPPPQLLHNQPGRLGPCQRLAATLAGGGAWLRESLGSWAFAVKGLSDLLKRPACPGRVTECGDHQAPVRNGIESHRLLCQAIDERPAMTGSSSVELECELIEVVIEMLTRHTSLVETQEPP